MPLSPDDSARGRQLANLNRGGPTIPGNRSAVRHGAHARISRDRLEARVAEMRDALAEDAPVKSNADSVVLTELAQAQCRLDDVRSYITQHGLLTDKGEVRPAVELERRLVGQVLDISEAMGMTPRSRAKLGLDIQRGLDLAQMWAQGEEGTDG